MRALRSRTRITLQYRRFQKISLIRSSENLFLFFFLQNNQSNSELLHFIAFCEFYYEQNGTTSFPIIRSNLFLLLFSLLEIKSGMT